MKIFMIGWTGLLGSQGAKELLKRGHTVSSISLPPIPTGVLKNNIGGNNYPVGYYNMEWKDMLKIFHRYMWIPNKKILTIPTFFYKLCMKKNVEEQKSTILMVD